MNQLSIESTAQIIGVSSATIRNWVKAGFLEPANTRPLSFSQEAVTDLKNQLADGSLQKLKLRANKALSKHDFIPLEYAASPDLIEIIAAIVEKSKHDSLELEPILFLAVLRQLEVKNELRRSFSTNFFDLSSIFCKRDCVLNELKEWQSSIDKVENQFLYTDIYDLLLFNSNEDFLGILYQSLLKEGNKSNQGSYYTPSGTVEDSLKAIYSSNIENFLDPCCGTGKYLIGAAKFFSLKPNKIYGFDFDSIAVKIARINMLLHFKEEDFSPHIYCLDSLSDLANGEFFCQTNHLVGYFDVIATNPPWGAYKNSIIPAQFQGIIKSGETYSMFLVKTIHLLKTGGKLSFILPESILKIKIHADIREFILEKCEIKKIVLLGRKFTSVFTPVIRIDAQKKTSSDCTIDLISENGLINLVNQERFRSNPDFTFDVLIDSKEKYLIEKIYKTQHFTLLGHGDWALGIVTGNNAQYLLDEIQPNSEAVFRGSDVQPFFLSEAKTFIQFKPENFQQVAPERFFRASEKLVYKFISKKLVFAFDNSRALTLNSANILIPRIPNMSIKVCMAFLNSTLFQFLFTKKFATHKVLRGDLEKLPFPILEKEIHDEIEAVISNLKAKDSRIKLDEIVFRVFNLSIEEIKSIQKTVGEL